MEYWKKSINFILKHPISLLLILIGTIIELAIIFPNGAIDCKNSICGMWFNERYIHDSIWHIALAQNSFNQYPFINPNYDGALLQGYNFLLDFIMYLLSIVGFSPFFSFYKLLPILFSILFPLTIIRYGLILKKTTAYIFFLLFFCYFGSGLGYILSLYHYGNLHESFLWRFPVSQTLQSGSILYNLQFAYSILILLIVLPYLYKKNSIKDIIFVGIGIFIATGFKFFGGITLLLLFGFKELIDLFSSRKNLRKIIITGIIYCISFVISIMVFYQPSKSVQSGSIFVFAPFALVHSMIEEKEMFYSSNLTNARYYLYSVGGFSPRLMMIQGYSVLLLILFNFGTRLVSLFQLFNKKILSYITPASVSIHMTIIISIIFTIFFIQKGDWFNTMQFLFYGVFLANFATADYLSRLTKKKSVISYSLVFIILILTLPSNVDGIRYWYDNPSYISSYELEALNELKKAPKGRILTVNSKNYSYISAFTKKNMYLADTQVLDITGIDYKNRLDELKSLTPDNLDAITFDYLYLFKNEKKDRLFINHLKKQKRYKEFFENEGIIIYKK